MNFRIRLTLMMLLISLTFCQLLAQNVAVEWGNESKLGDNKSINYPIGWEDGTYYNLRMDYNMYKNNYDAYIESVDKNKNIKDAAELDYESKATNNFEFVDYYEGIVYIYNTSYDNKSSQLEVYYESFDLNGKKIETKRVALFPLEKRKNYNPLIFSKSSNGEYLTAVHKTGRKKGDNLEYQIAIISRKNNVQADVYKGLIRYSGDIITIKKQQVNNEGKVVLLVQEQPDKKDDPKNYFLVYSNNKISERFDLEYRDMILDNFDFVSAGGNSVKIAGLYLSKLKKKKFYEGFFFSSFNPDNLELENFSSIAFDQKIISKYGKRAERKGSATVFGDYSLSIYPMGESNGGYIVAENLLISERISRNYRIRYHNFNELLVLSYNEGEELTNLDMILKDQVDSYKQTSLNLGIIGLLISEPPYGFKKLMEQYCSYSAFVENEKLYILFNDHENNEGAKTMDETLRLQNINTANVKLVIVDKEGEVKEKILFNNKDEDGRFTPSKTYNEGAPHMIGLMKRKSVKYGELKIKDL